MWKRYDEIFHLRKDISCQVDGDWRDESANRSLDLVYTILLDVYQEISAESR
jgi:hypothetical protein